MPAGPFTECAATGHDTGCGELIQVTAAGGVAIQADPGQAPYDGETGATLIGVLNSSPAALRSLLVTTDAPVFAFSGDGLCAVATPKPRGCPYGKTGYEGPGVSFTGVSADRHSATVKFTHPVASGHVAFFSLAQPLAANVASDGSPTRDEQGGAPNVTEQQRACGPAPAVNCATGAFWDDFTDVSALGRGAPLQLTRTYSSSRAGQDSPFGYGWSYAYGMSLSLDGAGDATIQQENGSTVMFQPDGAGAFTAPGRIQATLTHDLDGGYTFTRTADLLAYKFSADGQLTSITDADGEATVLTYAADRLVSVLDPAGRMLQFTYDGSHVSRVTGPDIDEFLSYQYDSAGELASVTDDTDKTWTYGYGPGHLMTLDQDPKKQPLTITYDLSGRVTLELDAVGDQTTWTYDGDGTSPAGGTTAMTDPNHSTTTYQYASTELTEVTRAAGTLNAATIRYTYGPADLVTSVTDGNGHATRYGYTPAGDVGSVTNPLGYVTNYTYTSDHQVHTVTDPLGHTVTYDYDEHRNLISVTDPSQHAITYGHVDPAHPGDVTSVIDAVGHVVDYGYDTQGDADTVTVTPQPGVTHATVYQFDTFGDILSTTNADGATTGAFYTDGRPAQITDAAGHQTTVTYDNADNPDQVTDADHNVTTYEYNAADRPQTTLRPDQSTVSFSYDHNGDQTLQINGDASATAYTYDAFGRVTSTKDALGQVTTYGYDRAGNEITVRDASGRTTSYGYDAANELVSITYSDHATPGVTYRYNEVGQRIEMTDGTGTTRYHYDLNGRLDSSTDGSGTTVGYTYDDAGELTELTYPGGRVVQRAYDGAGQLISVTDWLGNVTSFTYDAAGTLTTETYPNGVKATYSAAIVDSLGAKTLARYAYDRDDDGQITAVTTSLAGQPDRTDKFTYTSLNQLASGNGYRLRLRRGRRPDPTRRRDHAEVRHRR